MRAWRAYDRFEGRSCAAVVAVPHRHERLPRHAQRPPAPGPPDGHRAPSRRAGPRSPARRCPRRRGSSRCRPVAWCPTTAIPASMAVARESDPARVHRRAAAPAAAAAGRADPARGAALEGRARSPSCSDTTVASVNSALQRARATIEASNLTLDDGEPEVDDDQESLAVALPRRVRALRHGGAHVAASTRTPRSRCRRTTLWLRGRDDVVRAGGSARARAAGGPGSCRPRPTASRRSASTSRPATASYAAVGAAGPRDRATGRSRTWSSSSTPSARSRCSACRRAWTPEARPHRGSGPLPPGRTHYTVRMDRSLLDLTDKVAVITGGSRGIGKAIAFAYAEHGADVVIASRKLDNCQAVADEIAEKTGRKTLAVGTHVGRWDECNALADTVLETFGALRHPRQQRRHVAALRRRSPTSPRSTTTRSRRVNLKGPFALSLRLGGHMFDHDGGVDPQHLDRRIDPPEPQRGRLRHGQVGPQRHDRRPRRRVRPEGARQLHPARRHPHRHLQGLERGDDRQRPQDADGSRRLRRGLPRAPRCSSPATASAWITGTCLRVDGGVARQLGL